MKFRCIFLTSVYDELANIKSVQYALLPSPALQTVMHYLHYLLRTFNLQALWLLLVVNGWQTTQKGSTTIRSANPDSSSTAPFWHTTKSFVCTYSPITENGNNVQPCWHLQEAEQDGCWHPDGSPAQTGGFGFTEVICSLYNLSWFSLALLCSLQISPSYPLPVSCVRVGQLCSVFQLCQHFEGSVR